ncbi:MAG: hypothetical protein GX879_06030 [Bacteroidales bacterium]|nr:hypothetical protein [Bacteroidales bacterium]
MNKTIFEQSEFWITAKGEVCKIEEMETLHLLNILRMFELKPTIIQSLLIKEVNEIWGLNKEASLNNITSLSNDQLKEYFYKCKLYKAMREELEKRGVNVAQMLKNFRGE